MTTVVPKGIFAKGRDMKEAANSEGLELNTSGYKVKGHAVLIRPYEVERTTSSGIILSEKTADREQYTEGRAVIVQIGPLAWDDEPAPRFIVGDHVMIRKFVGEAIRGEDGKVYKVVADRDLYIELTRPDAPVGTVDGLAAHSSLTYPDEKED